MFFWLAIVSGLVFVGLKGNEVIEEVKASDWRKYDGLFKEYGVIYGVNWHWLKAIAMNESDLGSVASVARGLIAPWDTSKSVSSDGKSWGLMQVTLTTARTMDKDATPEKLNDPRYSVRLAALYLSQLQKMFSNLDPRYQEWVIKSYNQGPGNTRKEIQSGKSYAQEYWNRFQRNLKKVETTP